MGKQITIFLIAVPTAIFLSFFWGTITKDKIIIMFVLLFAGIAIGKIIWGTKA